MKDGESARFDAADLLALIGVVCLALATYFIFGWVGVLVVVGVVCLALAGLVAWGGLRIQAKKKV